MENFNGAPREDLCPECGCNVVEAREEMKEELFEKTFSQQLTLIRKRAKIIRAITGALLFMLFPPFIQWSTPRIDIKDPLDDFFWPIIFLVY